MLSRYRNPNEWPQVTPFGLVNWASPWRAFDLLTQHLNRAWEDIERYGDSPMTYGQSAQLIDKGGEFVLTIELPGVSKDEVELSVTGDNVFVRASREVEVPKGYSAHRRERSSYKFEHAWKLAVPVEAQKAEAQLHDGVLTITLPKSPSAQPKQIAVKAG
jgi:HSP20 family molecular chaperone IbpA